MSGRVSKWKLAGRWFGGWPLDGQYRTNAGPFHSSYGDRPVLHPTGRAWWWHHQAFILRGAIRTGVTLAVPLALIGLRVARTVTLSALAAALLAVLALAGWRLWLLLRQWNHRRRYVRPTRRAFAREIGAPPPRLEIGYDRSRVTIGFDDDFTATPREREAIMRIVATKLALEAPDEDWSLSGKKPHVTFTRSIPPPAKVMSADILAAVKAAAEHEVILGIGKKDHVIDCSVDSETPHFGMSMGTGDGKSTAAMNIATQFLWHGGLVVVLDYKLMSHMWARGLPNVAYAGTPEEIHQMLVWLAGDYDGESELTRRKQVALASADIRGNVLADLGPRMLILAEELNTLIKQLKKYWRSVGGKGPSPAIEALEELIFTGRQLRMHLLMIGQRLSAKATSGGGDGDVRENLGAILVSNPAASTWRMLADGHIQPPATDHKGRYHLITRKEVRELQAALWDEEDARAFATAGTVASPRHDMPFVPRRVPVATGVGHPPLTAHEGPDQAFVIGQGPDVPGLPGAVTLREAAAAGMFTSKAAAHKAVLRAGLASVGERGAAKLYMVEELASCQPRKAATR